VSTPAQSPLVPQQIDVVLQAATITMLGLPAPQSTTDPVYQTVRVGWQQQGQPAFAITEDVVFIMCTQDNDEYDKIRDRYYTNANFTRVEAYTRVWRVHWSVYGPNSFDNVRKIHSALWDDGIEAQLAAAQLYWVTNSPAPARIPELFGGQWWERVDFWAQFNEFVQEEVTAQSVESVEVIVENRSGIIADVDIAVPEV
jgi:hypothetical protein